MKFAVAEHTEMKKRQAQLAGTGGGLRKTVELTALRPGRGEEMRRDLGESLNIVAEYAQRQVVARSALRSHP